MRSVKYGVLAIFILLVAQGWYKGVEEFIDDQSNLNPYQTVHCLIYMGAYGLAYLFAIVCLVTTTEKENKNEQENSTRND